MKLILTVVTALTLAVGTSFAGCGKTETDKGKLKSVNAEQKKITIDVAGKEVTRTLTPSSKGAEKIDELVGKEVTVVSSHGKVETVAKG